MRLGDLTSVVFKATGNVVESTGNTVASVARGIEKNVAELEKMHETTGHLVSVSNITSGRWANDAKRTAMVEEIEAQASFESKLAALREQYPDLDFDKIEI